MEKKLKVVLIVLLMVLIVLVGFGGIYIKKKVSYNNILPDYDLGVNLTGSRITTLIVDNETEEVIYDKDGNVVEEIPEGADESSYTKQNVPVNSEESKNTDNYKNVEKIMTKRLKSLGVSNYDVRLNKDNGTISIDLADNDETDTILSYLLESGKFEVIDSNDKTVLMTNDDIEKASVLYNQGTKGLVVYLDIEFTNEGKKKIEQISKDYVTVEGTEENTESTEDTENAENTETVAQKEITININGEEFVSNSFEEPITNGRLTISIGSETNDTDDLNDYIKQAQHYATVLNNGVLPLTYEVEATEYIEAEFSSDEYKYIFIGVVLLLVIISILYMIIKYKKLGALLSVIYLATIAILLIIVRYTNAEITLETIISALILVLINTFINCKMLEKLDKKDNLEERNIKLRRGFARVLDTIIVALIPAILFTYSTNAALASIGIVLFWGIICIVTMNLLFTRKVLLMDVKK